jgi:hypothetical protein
MPKCGVCGGLISRTLIPHGAICEDDTKANKLNDLRQENKMNTETKDWLGELSRFLTADAWNEERIEELLVNVWLDGYKQGQEKTNEKKN